MKILVLNPNTSEDMTELVMRVLAPLTPAVQAPDVIDYRLHPGTDLQHARDFHRS